MNLIHLHPRLRRLLTRFGSLILLFQRMPVVQMLFPEAAIPVGGGLSNSIALAITTVVGLGAFDSVAGQSQINEVSPLAVTGKTPAGTSPTTANAINVPASVSAPLTFGFNWDPNDDYSTVKSWRATYNTVVGTLPTGLTPALVASGLSSAVGATQTISGTITTPGIYPVTVRVYQNTNYGGKVAAQIFNICVLGFSTQPASTSISSGTGTTLTCVVAGKPVATTLHTAAATLTYQWYEGTAPSTTTAAPGATNSPSYTTPNLTSTKSYWVKITSVLSGYSLSVNSTTATVTVTAATPTITTTGTLAAVNTTYGTASAAPTSFTVSGASMTAGITVTPPAGFEVSKTSSSTGYAGSGSAITVGAAGAIASTTVYVRLAATASVAGSPYSGNVVCSSTGATTANVATASSTVARKALTVTANGPAKTYGTALVTGTSTSNFAAGATGVGTEAVTSVTLTPNPAGIAATTAAGTAYSVTPSLATGSNGFLAGNYQISYTAYNGTVAKKALTVAATGPAKIAGTALVTGTSTSNFTAGTTGVGTEAVTSVTLTPNAAGLTAETAAGAAYSVTPSLATGSNGFLESNYQLSYTAYNGTVAANAYSNWDSGLPLGQNAPEQMPKNDGVTNLMKFACNLNPLAPDVRTLIVGGNGNIGLPGMTTASGKLRIEFLRRKASTNPGITYSPQFTSTLGSWPDTGASPTVTSIDAIWERVVVDDTVAATQRFGRLVVTQSP